MQGLKNGAGVEIELEGTDDALDRFAAVAGEPGQATTVRSCPRCGRYAVPADLAAKVDALAAGGMDDFEIPAFLRRQAD